MNFSYVLYLITFFGYPILSGILLLFVDFNKLIPHLKWITLFFISHNLLYYAGFSIKGDYPDYIIFSLEYFFFIILIIIAFKTNKLTLIVLGSMGSALILIGFIQAFFGIFLFIIMSQDLETDKIYTFESDEKSYQTRRYSFGFATLDDTTYSYETYKTYNYLPFEKLIDKSKFSGIESRLNFQDDNFNISIETDTDKKVLIFSSPNEKPYKVDLE